MGSLVGRETELQQIRDLSHSRKSELLALYGRRRIGKTFLIREACGGELLFTTTALSGGTLAQQLENFRSALEKQAGHKIGRLGTWMEAFGQLQQLVEESTKERKIIFIDELPWFDTPRSNFIQALEHWWNAWATARKDIFLIVCGSAASWMINKLIRNTGGLYNRVTARIRLEPFTLHETELFLRNRRVNYDRYQIVQLYMVLGGVPFYLDQVNPSLSAAQNIDALCFHPNGMLRFEFDQLYRSLFKDPEHYIVLIETMGKKTKGLTREEILHLSGVPNSGRLTYRLRELEESGFIRKYIPFGKKMQNSLYQLTDFYSLFYLKFIRRHASTDKNRWLAALDNPAQRAWSGYAFEQICFAHIDKIKQALGISGIETSTSSWTGAGGQIDLLIDRRDRVINLCEMKFSVSEFSITKAYAMELRRKIGAFQTDSKTRKAIFLTFITTFGLKKNEYASSLVQASLTMDALF